MTERLYYHDAYLREFDARVTGCTEQRASHPGDAATRYEVLLDRTAFYPTSGGQPHDTGWLGDAAVAEVFEREDGTVVHFTDRLLAPGVVHGAIDWHRRFDHMQQHTGQHLLSAVFLERFRMPTVSFHLGRDLSTVDLNGPALTGQQVEEAERQVNALVFDDRHVTVRFGTRDELAAMGVCKEVVREGTLRAIEVEGVECQPCGGTHVRRTGEVGVILLRKWEKQRGNWRVEFLCGRRALAAARGDFGLLAEAARHFSCAPAELPAQVERALEDRQECERKRQRLLERLSEVEAQALLAPLPAAESDAVRVLVRIFDDADAAYLRMLATRVVAAAPARALLASRTGGYVVFAQTAGLPGDVNALLREVLSAAGGKGGGTCDFAQGSVPASTALESLLTAAASRLASGG